MLWILITMDNVLNGKPEKVIINLAIPIFIYLLVNNLYNVVDGMWITGIGKAAVAGVGAIMPLFSVITGIGMGIGTGATSTISYFIGKDDKDSADNVAVHTIVIMVIVSIILAAVLILSLDYYLNIFQIDSNASNQAVMYAIPLFLNSFIFIFIGGLTGILRGEGDARKQMIASCAGHILNAVIDPVFIYTLGMGVVGAAVSTVISSLITLLILAYWIVIKKDTYLNFSFKSFKPDFSIVKRILRVGIPASVEMLIMTVATTCYLWFISSIGANQGVAIYTGGNKIYYLGMMPISAICMAMVPVVGNAFGQKDADKIKKIHSFACKLSVGLGILLIICIFIFAEPLSFMFAYTAETSDLLAGLVECVRILIFCLLFLGIGLPSTFLYQGLSRGFQSLSWTLIRELLSSVLFIYLFGFCFSWGLTGVWLGLLVGRTCANILNYIFAKYTLRNLQFADN